MTGVRACAALHAALAAGLLTGVLAGPPAAAAQHAHGAATPADQGRVGSVPRPEPVRDRPMQHSKGPNGAPGTYAMASGTSWLPRSAPVRGAHVAAGRWTLMVHGVAYGHYTKQSGRRGGWQAGSINWAMLAAARPAAGGRLELRAMGSAEPYTLGRVGYPLLLQTGETYQGVPLHDRQHPHDLAMELSATYERRLLGPVGGSLYLAAVGEPAAGPVAFMHRPSAAGDPFAPLSHHWQDASHVTFGVITGGLFTRDVKIEGSLFNGREPDERRTNFDYRGRRLDSWATRLTILAGRSWALSGWYAFLESPEAFYSEDWQKRVGASVLHSRPLRGDGVWSSALIWGAKRHEPSAHHPVTRLTHSVTAESSLELGPRNTLFARVEHVQKDVEELFLPHVREEVYDVRSVAAGYVYDVVRAGGGALGVGVRGSINFLPERLALFYGDTKPTGAAAFLRLGFARRPAAGAPRAGHTEH